MSNLAYLTAAFALWRLLRRHSGVPASVAFMPPLAVLIGVGSFAFHTLATRWAQVLDIAPIGLFVFIYVGSFLRWFYRLPWTWCLAGVAGFACVTAAFIALLGSQIPNRSAPYVPVLLLMIGLTVALYGSHHEDRSRYWRDFATAAGVFSAGLLARTIDEEACGSFPIGTHFIWHLLTELLIFVVGRALARRWHSLAEAGDTRLPATPAGRSRSTDYRA
ncbi:hypothetical protein ThrDRAFT_01156 [Frankia casuarinae]|uniref:Membrane protein, putative n=1 Tax=Frankia casuarinae (strain DSM 45818 / CECT 9043 / HFP020203 / CcI3) TaxID=106370 RepID=Q2JAD8_FRACC|nr:ceramidase domain-containing protein [Frankia casuarinae]ABD11754.1 membrane protein, putative [Frankia casuarinae]EYT93186.1 hypothetical protein ThrDRAFT_01156 [Frankia casuarinae]